MDKKRKISSDIILKNYWRNPERFADFFNQILFRGEQVINPECLIDVDTDVSGTVEEKNGIVTSLGRRRDVIKKTTGEIDFVLVGLENQRTVNYAMPLRCRIYDDMNYLSQCKVYAPGTGDVRTWSKEEFLSGMKKEDRLNLSITIVIYYGEEAWSGPKSLSDMMCMPEVFKPFFDDYRMRLFEVSDIKHNNFRHSDVQELFQLLNCLYECKGDRQAKIELLNQYPETHQINYDVLNAVIAASGNETLFEHIYLKEGDVSMCQLFDAIEKEGIEKGIEKGIRVFIPQLRKLKMTDDKICECLMDEFQMSLEEAQKYVVK